MGALLRGSVVQKLEPSQAVLAFAHFLRLAAGVALLLLPVALRGLGKTATAAFAVFKLLEILLIVDFRLRVLGGCHRL